ncbi:P-loop containing nucleoside triphosphate hydrolase protein [Artomyces pyxidatus]|uniref:P-loop containing nucleoside triphosphate hydrolase protein n=1 Tax=Artomyces pyxidatus TaxID=48021 RepID=A0ACB8SKN1_9AGAM|nr:P-loop containing nucleoside triphosphate hydrolase protein [Artomyces pyxidatus]
MFGRRRTKGIFDPNDLLHTKHHRLGVWDLYVQYEPKLSWIPSSWKVEAYAEIINDLPYLWRTIRDVGRTCWHLLIVYVVLLIGSSLLPALSLWYSGQLLKIVQTAVDDRTVDKRVLFQVAGGRMTCSLIERVSRIVEHRVSSALNNRIKQYYSGHIFHAMARLDVPTYEDPVVSSQLDSVIPTNRHSIVWSTLSGLLNTGTNGLRLCTQSFVLLGVLQEQRDGHLLTLLTFSNHALSLLSPDQGLLGTGGTWAWAATTHDQDYIRMEGLKRLVTGSKHRKELVAGGLSEFLTNRYRKLVDRLGHRAGDFWTQYNERTTLGGLEFLRLIRQPLKELPQQIVFTLRAVQYPSSIPVSLASLNLMQQTSDAFALALTSLAHQAGSIAERLSGLRKLYEAENIQNKVQDGTMPFPEDAQSIRAGISIEFKDVSFQYHGSDEYALRHVSFKVEPGQLCVIVGSNGSGKSTILKLVARIYDVTEGHILVDGKDIKTLRLDDLRRAMAILFQDYTLFPLSIKDNIALGDPENADDEDKIREAARLGGAEDFIARLPDGFDTYLERPVRDLYSGLPEGTKTLFGRSVDHSNFGALVAGGGRDSAGSAGLSGGQLQRLAVSRTFMRSSVSEPKVGLLLFDEPSASLDPTAEQDLFARLRELRGNKTMVFSTHRFGNLTRHADLIMYMHDSVILETGTHEQLLKAEGDYSRLWKMQAQAFL